MDYTDVIKDLLSKNVTPEKIYQTALDELKKIQAEEEQKKDLVRKREHVVEAVVEYLTAAFPKTKFGTPDQLAESIEKALKAMEESGGDLFKIGFGLNFKDFKDLEEKMKKTDEIFDKFLRKNGWGY